MNNNKDCNIYNKLIMMKNKILISRFLKEQLYKLKNKQNYKINLKSTQT